MDFADHGGRVSGKLRQCHHGCQNHDLADAIEASTPDLTGPACWHVGRLWTCVEQPSSAYEPRDPTSTILYGIVRDYFETFRAHAASLRDGEGLPRFVEQEFRGTGGGRGGRGGSGGGFGVPAGGAPDTLTGASAALSGVMNALQGADVQPTVLQVTSIETALRNGRAAMARWNMLKTTELAALSAQLKAAGIAIK